MNAHAYTRPERATERNLGQRVLAKIRRNPCQFCRWRKIQWGLCEQANRNPDRCLADQRHPTFTLDESTIK